MICNKCGKNNPDSYNYCPSCNNQLKCTCGVIINKSITDSINFCTYCGATVRRADFDIKNTSNGINSEKESKRIVTDEKQQALSTSAFNSDNKKTKEHSDTAATTEKKNEAVAKETEQVAPIADTSDHQTNSAQKSEKQNVVKTPQQKNNTKAKETKEKASLSAAKKNDQEPSEQKNKKGNDDKAVFREQKNRTFVYQPRDYAYAKCTSISEKGVYWFCCIDNKSIFNIPIDKIQQFTNGRIGVGDYIWVRLMSRVYRDSSLYIAIIPQPHKKGQIAIDCKYLAKRFNVGDIIKAPINSIMKNYLEVSLTPSFSKRIYHINASQYKKGDIIAVKIVDILYSNKKLSVNLSIIYEYEKRMLWDILPKALTNNNTFISTRFIDKAFNSARNRKRYKDLFESTNPSYLLNFFASIYAERYKDKKVNTHQDREFYYMSFDTGKKDTKGVPVYVNFRKKKDGNSANWVAIFMGFGRVANDFDNYLLVKNWHELLDNLASKALRGETWDLPGREEKYILKEYFRFTFYKAKLDGLIVENEIGAIFNTGLVDNSYDDIYCYLRRNRDKSDFFNRKWEFGYFATTQDDAGKELNVDFASFPDSPKYINNLQDVYFDMSLDLNVDYKHIIIDNNRRLPFDFIVRELRQYTSKSHDQNVEKMLADYDNDSLDKHSINKILDYIADDKQPGYTCIKTALGTAVDVAQKYCKWNYKNAIPIYYPHTNGISLLLPLCLTNYDNVADVALVVERIRVSSTQNDVETVVERYQGQTILTLDMAYQDARQICRPNSEWLTPDLISASDEDNDIDDED